MTTDISYSRIPSEALARWRTVRDCVSGDQAMRAGGYLPLLNASDISQENKDRNDAYRERAVYYNATGRTLQGLIGLAFRKDPKPSLPEKLAYLVRDADGRRNSIYQQSQASVAHTLTAGRHGLYVDFDAVSNRPVIKPYSAESIINWRYEADRLALVVLSEQVDEPDGYGLQTIVQYRELAMEDGLCVCRVWRAEGEKGELAIVETTTPANRTSGRLKFIPFQFIGANNNDADIDPVPLYDLARLNVAHYRNSADYEDSVFFVGQAQPYIAGLTEEWRDHLEKQKTAYVGSRAPFLLPAGGAFGFAQPGANTLVKEAMDQKEVQMVALGARLLDQNAVQVTATQSENDRETSTSVLSLCVANVNEAYQQCIAWCAVYLDSPLTEEAQAASYKISQDYTRSKIDPQVVGVMVSAWQAGVFAKPDLRAYLRAEGAIAVERTDEEIDSDLETQGPALGTIGGV